jgi:putative glycosyltransferase (TIGR04372 family)
MLFLVLYPAHLLAAIVIGSAIRLRSNISGVPIRIVALPTYSFAPLVMWSPRETQDEAADWHQKGGRTFVFLHATNEDDQPFILARIVEHSHESVKLIRSRVLVWFYGRFRPPHLEDPLFKTWQSHALPSFASPVTSRSTNYAYNDAEVVKGIRATFSLGPHVERFEDIVKRHGYSPRSHRGIIAFNIRDAAYRNSQSPYESANLEMHPRNSIPQDFSKAILAAIERGYFCVRVGKLVAHPLNLPTGSWWDYAGSDYHSEEMDFWIAENCSLAISTSSGWDALPPLFGRPVSFVGNGDELLWSNSEYAEQLWPVSMTPKKFVERDSGRVLLASELARYAMGDRRVWQDLCSREPRQWRVLQIGPQQTHASALFAIDCLEQPELLLIHQQTQRVKILEFWERCLTPLGMDVPSRFPAFPEPFFNDNSHWLIN